MLSLKVEKMVLTLLLGIVALMCLYCLVQWRLLALLPMKRYLVVVTVLFLSLQDPHV